jgi:hypothetical protein
MLVLKILQPLKKLIWQTKTVGALSDQRAFFIQVRGFRGYHERRKFVG